MSKNLLWQENWELYVTPLTFFFYLQNHYFKNIFHIIKAQGMVQAQHSYYISSKTNCYFNCFCCIQILHFLRFPSLSKIPIFNTQNLLKIQIAFSTYFLYIFFKYLCFWDIQPFSVFLLHWVHPSSPEHCPSLLHAPRFDPAGRYPSTPSAPFLKSSNEV